MDAITLLRNDHRSVEQLFKRFEKAGDQAFVEKRAIVDRIVEELSVHAAIEEQLFYPVTRATVPGVEDVALESLEEHHIVKWVLSELDHLAADAERFDAKVTVLMESVRHHVKEEESEFFPKVRNELGRKALTDLGDAMAEAKKTAPTSPHPRSPDDQPANGVVGAVAGVLDRVGDNLSGIAQGSVTAVQDVIARVLHTKRPRVSPTGSSTARRRAQSVRQAASDAADGIETTARRAVGGAIETGKAASSGAKATATTARKSAAQSVGATATTAKRANTRTGNTARAAVESTTTSAKKAARKTAASARDSR